MYYILDYTKIPFVILNNKQRTERTPVCFTDTEQKKNFTDKVIQSQKFSVTQ